MFCCNNIIKSHMWRDFVILECGYARARVYDCETCELCRHVSLFVCVCVD